MLAEVDDLVERGEAFFEVLQRVVAPVRLAVACDEGLVQRAIREFPA
jgi:hypothetical protein